MRIALAILFAAYVAVIAGLPHGHGESHHAHECIACSAGGGEVCEAALPDVAPRVLWPESIALAPVSVPSSGAPLGAIPGQSPPAI